MIPFIIGGVTLAAVGYVIKEYCEEEGCPWDEPSYSNSASEEDISTASNDESNISFKKSKEFHKFKKEIYKTSMKEYQEFLQKHQLQNSTISTEAKLEKYKFDDELITDEIASYITQISETLDILSHNLSLGIRLTQNQQIIEAADVTKLNNYTNSIYTLAHLELFDADQNLNKVEILSALVQAMGSTTQKDMINVSLESA